VGSAGHWVRQGQRNLLDTSSFLFRLSSSRLPRNTSASSSSSMAFHSRQSSRACVRAGSTASGLVPSIPALTMYRGTRAFSATAVR
jgi:hypothetical protein